MTAGFLKRLARKGEVSAVRSAVREIVLSGGAGYEGFLKPVADAVAIVEAKDTRLYVNVGLLFPSFVGISFPTPLKSIVNFPSFIWKPHFSRFFKIRP